MNPEIKIIIIIASYIFLITTSGFIIKSILSRAEKGKLPIKMNGIPGL